MTRYSIFVGTIALAFGLSIGATARQHSDRQLEKPASRDVRTQMSLSDEVRHQLLTLPYYGIFDWLEAEVDPGGTVVLSGEVVRPSTRSDAESRVRKLEGVTAVKNEIETLPVSTFDNETRVALYRRLAREPGFEKYFMQAVPPIHIIVKGGHVTLKGVVDSPMDSQLAYTTASGLPNVFDVKNELHVVKD